METLNLKVEELEERIAPSATLSVTIPTTEAAVATVPPAPAPVDDAAAAANEFGNGVTVEV